MKRYILVLLFSLGWLAIDAHAEGPCPPGYFPAVQPPAGPLSCGPIPGYNQQPAAPSERPAYWDDRYGAVAWDPEVPGHGGIGIAEQFTSARKARKAALKDCVNTGGDKKTCKLVIEYSNGCMAMAEGATGIRSPHVKSTYEEAKASSMEACESDTTDCKIVALACSKPVLSR
ncbi:DUF4189 domain-containing protein [Pseudoxanthomonas dokdonensis]|uniref:DUF4189 domain-containing protein n=1 Tax=Pseudoxanthomonas dokdonensis TaxID=344882 RepID=UPI0009F8EF8D